MEGVERGPGLAVRSPDDPVRAVVLLLSGGREDSYAPATGAQLTAVRMRPFAVMLHRRGRRAGLVVATLRYRFRGWNGPAASPVADARWALDELRRRFGLLPVVLVGHSMGGRTALRVADDPAVRGVAALAPWLSDDDPVQPVTGRRVLIAHGTRDMVTSPEASRRWAARAEAVGAAVAWLPVRGDGHPMLFRYPVWRRLVAGFVSGCLGAEPLPRQVRGLFPADR